MFVFSLWSEMHKRSSFICTRVLHSLPAAERLLCLQEGWGVLWDPSGSLSAPEGCSWRPGEICNILSDWKSGKFSATTCFLSAFLSCCVCDPSLSPSGGLSWLCPQHLPALGFLLRSSLHFFSRLSYFLEEFRHIIPAFEVSHIQMLKLLIHSYH